MNEKPLFKSVKGFLDTPIRALLRRLTPARTTDLHGITIPEIGNVVVVVAYGPDADWLVEAIKVKGEGRIVKYGEGTMPGDHDAAKPRPADG